MKRFSYFLFACVLVILLLPVLSDYFLPWPEFKGETTPDFSISKVSFGSDPTASVHMVAFLDFQCPVCKADWPLLKSLESSYRDRINFAMVVIPSQAHPNAYDAAKAYHCSGDAKEMADLLFQDPAGNYSAYAQVLGFDVSAFDVCMAGKMDRIDADAVFALSHGVKGTPTYFIDGIRFEGSQTQDTLRNVIDSALEARS